MELPGLVSGLEAGCVDDVPSTRGVVKFRHSEKSYKSEIWNLRRRSKERGRKRNREGT